MKRIKCYLKMTILLFFGRRPGIKALSSFYLLLGDSRWQAVNCWRDYLHCIVKVRGFERSIYPAGSSGSLDAYDNERVLKAGVTIVTACMNRNENLKASILTWLQLPVNEIVVVDWSSSIPVDQSIDFVQDSRLKICRIDNEKHWHLTRAFNVAIRLAAFDKVYKFDCDICVSSDFLDVNKLVEGRYLRGSWLAAKNAERLDQIYVNGSFAAFKHDLKSVGYYNELISTYGWDDSNLYSRLNDRMLSQFFFSSQTINHLHQDEEERTKHQTISETGFLGLVKASEYHNTRNKYLSAICDSWKLSQCGDYMLHFRSKNMLVGRAISQPPVWPGYALSEANFLTSLHFLRRESKMFSPWPKQEVESFARFMAIEYEEGIPSDISASLLFDPVCADVIIGSFRQSQVHSSSKKAFRRVEVLSEESARLVDLVRKSINLEKLHFCVDSNESGGSIDRTILFGNAKKKLFVNVQHGLGNRLRALASAMVLARKFKRELIVIWEKDEHCGCHFEDLFSCLEFPVLRGDSELSFNHIYSKYSYMENEEGAEKNRRIDLSLHEDDVYIKSAYRLNYEGLSWKEEHEMLTGLTFSDEVLDVLSKVDINAFDVGVHVRMQGAQEEQQVGCDGAHNWSDESHNEIVKWRKLSHYDTFISRVKELEREVDINSIYLAADNPEAYEAFVSEFGDRVTFLERDLYDRSKEQMYYALADAFLLSKSSTFLSSGWSSFGELASRYACKFNAKEVCGVDF